MVINNKVRKEDRKYWEWQIGIFYVVLQKASLKR